MSARAASSTPRSSRGGGALCLAVPAAILLLVVLGVPADLGILGIDLESSAPASPLRVVAAEAAAARARGGASVRGTSAAHGGATVQGKSAAHGLGRDGFALGADAAVGDDAQLERLRIYVRGPASGPQAESEGEAAAAGRFAARSEVASLAADIVAARASIPASCLPQLQPDGSFGPRFAERAMSLPPLTYEDILSGSGGSGARLWASARIDAASVKGGLAAFDGSVVQRARMAPRSLGRYCVARTSFRADHAPEGGCPDDNSAEDHTAPTFNYPWCFPPSDPVHVASVDCGVVENYVVHEAIAFTLFTNEHVVATDRERWNVNPSVRVREFAELAAMGAAEYPTEAGHFPNEDLPALLFLDRALPADVPLLWPSPSVPRHWHDELQREGLLTPGREIVFIEGRGVQTHFRARRLYFFRSSRSWGESPYISWYAQRLMMRTFAPVLARRASGKSLARVKRSIVVLQRHGGARVLANHGELVQRLGEWLGPDVAIEAFVPGPQFGHSMWKTADNIYGACLLIGPHGGNMPNLMFMRQGCWVVEVGFVDASFALPTDFYCFARNLGLSYHLSIASEGSYGAPLVADLDDIRDIVMAYKREVLDVDEA